MTRIALALSALAAVTAAVALPSSASGGLSECPPDAPPLRGTCVFHIDDHFTDPGTCAFPLHVDVVGKIVYTPRRDKQGNLIGEIYRPNLSITVTNPANGRTVYDRDVGLDKATFNPDGSIRVLSTGLHAKVRTGDRQTVFRRIGLQIITISPEGVESVEIVGGNFQPESDFEKEVCSYLAGG